MEVDTLCRRCNHRGTCKKWFKIVKEDNKRELSNPFAKTRVITVVYACDDFRE